MRGTERRPHGRRPPPIDLAAAWAFTLGSVCFAVAAIPVLASAGGAIATNTVFTIGSVFFTAGALFQQTSTGWHLERVADARNWWASAVQLLGTVFFNVSTAAALAAAVPAGAAGGSGWRPDVYGSACFLVSSGLAVAAARADRPRGARSRREAVLNLVGSVLFGLSAVGAYIRPATDSPVSAFWTDFGTLGGALLFLLSALLGMRR